MTRPVEPTKDWPRDQGPNYDHLRSEDVVNHANHYRGTGGLEPINVAEAFQLPSHLMNSVKYILRHRDKNAPVEDLRKAVWYITRYLFVEYQVVLGDIDIAKPLDKALLGFSHDELEGLPKIKKEVASNTTDG